MESTLIVVKQNRFYGKHHSESTKTKLSLINKNKHRSPKTEFNKGCAPINKGIPHTNETRKKISESHKGKVRSLESRLKQSQSVSGIKHPLYGKHHTEGSRQKNRERHLGKKHSETTKQKLSVSHIGLLAGVNHYLYGKYHSDKTKQKMSQNHKDCFGKENNNWIDGRSYLPYCHRFNDKLKEAIRARDNHICQLCKTPQNGIKLAAHHIHYDKENCYPDLITLCRSCNSKVNANRKYHEFVFMNNLNDRGLLLWTKNNGAI